MSVNIGVSFKIGECKLVCFYANILACLITNVLCFLNTLPFWHGMHRCMHYLLL